MTLTDEQFRAAHGVWQAQLDHPFVRGIGSGDLPDKLFANWVVQDYLYLQEYARVFGFAAARADRAESMAWHARLLHLILHSELELHRQYAARFGIGEKELTAAEMWPTNRAYTDFLVRTASQGDRADVIAVLLPCAWGYVYIAQHLAEAGVPADTRYADWVRQYTSEEFVNAAGWLIQEMERLGEGACGAERQRLIDLFVLSSRYELRFWDMCWKGEQSSP